MKTFEEFCNSNILQVILKNHNEGGSRDVERLTRKAYDEYIKYPHLRHIEGHQLREITFFPPKLSTEEQRLCRLNGVEECHVDLYSLDNWCAWGEWYLLLKLKRTDNRDNVAIANSAMYLKNLPIVALKYCRNKLRDEKEQRLEDERAKLEKQARAKLEEQAGTSRKSIITDFFKAKTSKSPRKKKKIEMLRLFNPEDQNRLTYSPSPPPEELQQPKIPAVPDHIFRKPGPASSKKLLMERYLQDVVAAKNPPVSQDDPSADQELEDIREQFKVRDLPLKAGPKSKLKAQLKRLQTQEAKIKAGPASKKRAKLQKIYGQPEVVGQRKDDEENVSDNTPPMQPTGEARKAQPIRGMEADIASREVCRNAKRGTPLWMLLYGVYDPVRKIFVDPNPPSPEKIDPPPQVTQSPIPEPVRRRHPAKFAPPAASSPMPMKFETPTTESSSHDTPAKPSDAIASVSQSSSLVEEGVSLRNILEKNAREILAPKLFHCPEVLRRVKEMLVDKAKVYNTDRTRPSLDKSHEISLSHSQDSLVTVIRRTTTNEASTTKEKDNSVAELLQQQQQQEIVADNSTEPEMVLCDPRDTQSQVTGTQVAFDPFQSQLLIATPSPQKKKMKKEADESQIELSTAPQEIILIEDSNSLDEILGVSSEKEKKASLEEEEKSSENEKSSEVEKSPENEKSPAEEKSPEEETPLQSPEPAVARTPQTRNKIKLEATPSTSAAATTPKAKRPYVKKKTTTTTSPVTSPRAVRGDEKEAVAFRYGPLPLQHKKGAEVAAAEGEKEIGQQPRGRKRGRKPKKKNEQEEEIHKKVRFREQTEGTARGMDIQDASMVEEQGDEIRQKAGKSKRSLIESLEEILGQRRREAAEEATEVNAFSFNKVMRLSCEQDGKGKFYSDSCGARCALAMEFTAEGQRRLQFDVDINRHLLDLTQDQWESFQRLMQSVDKFEYSGWTTRSGGGFFPTVEEEEGVNCCIIKRTLNLLLKTTPKLGVNVGAIKHSTGIGTRPVFLRTIPEGHGPPKLDLSECIKPEVLKRMEAIVTARKKKNRQEN